MYNSWNRVQMNITLKQRRDTCVCALIKGGFPSKKLTHTIAYFTGDACFKVNKNFHALAIRNAKVINKIPILNSVDIFTGKSYM